MTNLKIIAEIGTAHQGDLTLATQLIQAAKASGATCAKFQALFADEIIHKNAGMVPLPGGSIALYQRFKSLEQPASFYAQLKQKTEEAGLEFLCTPFGLKSFEILKNLKVTAYKIASPELNHLPLINAVAAEGKPIFLSLGVSLLSDIEEALHTINGRAPVTLLQCVTSYPAPPQDYNLAVLKPLKKLFGVEVGVSDHTMDPVLVPSLAVYEGAIAVEKHICLSRNDDGLDDPIALEPQQFKAMSLAINAMKKTPEESFQQLISKYGKELCIATLGSGQKTLAPSERANYGRTNRSICAIDTLHPGDVLTNENTALYRVEKELKPGMSPKMWPILQGRMVKNTIKAGNGITFDDI